MVSTILLLPLKTVPTDIAHGHTDGLGAIRDNDTTTTETYEQGLDDLRSDRVVLCQETCHRPVVGVWGALQVYRGDG